MGEGYTCDITLQVSVLNKCWFHPVYGHPPNRVAPILFSVLFAISTLVHIYQNLWVPRLAIPETLTEIMALRKYNSWKITGALPWGGVVFVAGFAMREVSIYNDQNLGEFIAYQCLLLIAPLVFLPALAWCLLNLLNLIDLSIPSPTTLYSVEPSTMSHTSHLSTQAVSYPHSSASMFSLVSSQVTALGKSAIYLAAQRDLKLEQVFSDRLFCYKLQLFSASLLYWSCFTGGVSVPISLISNCKRSFICST